MPIDLARTRSSGVSTKALHEDDTLMLGARPRLIIGLVVGAAIVAALVIHTGLPTFEAAIASLSWRAIGAACLFQVGAIILCGVAWWVLTEGSGLVAVTSARWVREGSSTLLAVVPGIGELAGGRALALTGTRVGDVAASTVVDVVVDTAVLAVVALLGVVPLLAHADINRAVYGMAAAAAVALPVAAIWLVSRHKGAVKAVGGFVSRAGRKVGITGDTNDLDLAQRIATIHGRHRHVAAAALLHLAAWLLGAVQLWVAAAILGIPLSFPSAFSLHAIGSAARGVFFAVPMGAGVQEVSFVLVGSLVGVSEPTRSLFPSFFGRETSPLRCLPCRFGLWRSFASSDGASLSLLLRLDQSNDSIDRGGSFAGSARPAAVGYPVMQNCPANTVRAFWSLGATTSRSASSQRRTPGPALTLARSVSPERPAPTALFRGVREIPRRTERSPGWSARNARSSGPYSRSLRLVAAANCVDDQ
jgi:uncharacterized membrane protein YbhN (UPF0104 family)